MLICPRYNENARISIWDFSPEVWTSISSCQFFKLNLSKSELTTLPLQLDCPSLFPISMNCTSFFHSVVQVISVGVVFKLSISLIPQFTSIISVFLNISWTYLLSTCQLLLTQSQAKFSSRIFFNLDFCISLLTGFFGLCFLSVIPFS